MQVLALSEENRVVSGARGRGISGASTGTSTFAPVKRRTPEMQLSTPRPCHHSDLEKTVNDMEATYLSMNQISKALKAIVQSTQHAVMSEDRLLHRKVAQVYQDLSKTGIQIQQLKSSTTCFQEFKERMTVAASNGNPKDSKFQNPDTRQNGLDKSDSAVIEVFFDCVSRFSSRDSSHAIDELQANFFGPPEYRFELLPSFYPEQYVLEGSICNESFAVAMLPSTDSHQKFRYFLDYAETARRWQKVVVFAAFHGERPQIDTLRVASSDLHVFCAPKTLPSAVHRLLRTILPLIEFYSSVTQISLDLRVGKSGQITAESPRVEVIEDESEISKSDEREFLKYIESVCCKRYVESDVITYSRISSTSYKVFVDSQACVENKVLFASGKRQGNNAFLDYLSEIKHHISLRRCTNVAEFRGIVLDDTRQHLRSYLQEPMMTSVESLLALATSRSKMIPWFIRELWARQLIQAMIEIHSQGLTAGLFNLNSVGIRGDGTAVFHPLQHSEKYVLDSNGLAPPELRNRHRNNHSGSAARNKLNFQTDIFQLGMLLWLLVEHVPKDMGHFCARSACMHSPRSTCVASHANPVELPKCRDDAPAYLCDIIRDCRLQDPQSRVSARELDDVLRSTPLPDNTPSEIQQALMPHISSGIEFDNAVYCDECGGVTTDIHFHCNLCDSGDYDICPACFENGHRCLVPEHRLVKRARGKYDYIDIS